MVGSKKNKQKKGASARNKSTVKTSVKKSGAKKKKAIKPKRSKPPIKNKPKQAKPGIKNKPKQAKSPEKKSASKKNKSDFVLGTVMVINEVKLLHKKLTELSVSKETVTLDASKIEMIDTAVIQLLLAFVSTMNNRSVDIKWKNPSQAFLERASILNLTDVLCLGEARR